MDHINWDELSTPRPNWCPGAWRLWALWPSPVDHDACFEAAGFADFADSTETWHFEFAQLVANLLAELGQVGRPRLAEGEYPTRRARTRESALDALLAAALDDNFRPCLLAFGHPPQALIRSSDGHPILWIALEAGDATALIAVAAKTGKPRQRALDWSKLLQSV